MEKGQSERIVLELILQIPVSDDAFGVTLSSSSQVPRDTVSRIQDIYATTC